MLLPYQLETKLRKQLPKPFTTILYFNTDFQNVYTQTKVLISNPNLSGNFVTSQE